MKARIFHVRFNLDKEKHRQAWAALQRLQKEKGWSYSESFSEALVAYGGHGYEVLRLVVVAFAFLQGSAQPNAARDHDQISSDDDHQHRDKEPHHGVERIVDRDGEPIGRNQDNDACERQHPVALGRLFTDVLGLHQINGTGRGRSDDGGQPDQRKDNCVADERPKERAHVQT